MKVLTFKTEEEWKKARIGKITGTRANGIISRKGTEKKKAYYELIAELVAEPREETTETPMERGKRLQDESLALFTQQTGFELDTNPYTIWVHDDFNGLALSPDATVLNHPFAVETKSLSQASHVQAYLTQQVPKEYEEQSIQYFVVNEKLEKLFFCFYDPSVPQFPFFYITLNREDVQDEIDYQFSALKELYTDIKKIVTDLTF